MFGCDEDDNNNEGSDDEDNVDDKYYYEKDEYDYNPFMNDNDKVVTMMMITLLKMHISG